MTVSLQGLLHDFSLPQVVALLEAMQSTGRLEVSTSDLSGVLFFRRGHMTDARSEERVGALAAYLILAAEEGEFRYWKEPVDQEDVLAQSNQSLCMESMRLVDESRDPSAVFSVAPVARELGLAVKDPADRAILDAIGGTQATIRRLSEACSMSRLEVLFRLEALGWDGLVLKQSQDSDVKDAVNQASSNVRVLVVDDSKLMRRNLSRLFDAANDMEVVGEAASGREALELIPEVRPDVISLDLHMPEMDGVETLKRVMLSDPIPTVILTAANPEELDRTFDAILRFGAVDFVTKPSRMKGEIDVQGRAIVERIRTAAQVNLRGIRLFQSRLERRILQASPRECSGLMTAVAGTGACLSLMQLLSHLPADLPYGVLCVTSMSGEFLRAFGSYMGKYSSFKLKVAEDGDRVMAGVCYLANQETPIRIAEGDDGAKFVVNVGEGPTDPNLLLYDTARLFGSNAVGLLMSNEKDQWDSGLEELTVAGGVTLAQLPETCVDSTGPKAAIDRGLIQRTVVLNRLARELSQILMRRTQRLDEAPRSDGGEDSWKTARC